jgi:hypothetical protein
LLSAGKSQLDGFNISGGEAQGPDYFYGGGVLVLEGEVTLSNNVIENNDIGQHGEDSFGGGVMIDNARAVVENNHIRNNGAGSGAGVGIQEGDVEIRRNTIAGNVATGDHGGGIWGSGTLLIANNLVHGNRIGEALGYGQGGGILVFGAGSVGTLVANVVGNNFAVSFGAGVFFDEGAKGTMQNDILYRNCLQDADGGGAAIYVDGTGEQEADGGSSLTITNATVANNHCDVATTGLGLKVEGYSSATVVNSIFWDNNGDDFTVDGSSVLTVSHTLWQRNDSGSLGENNIHDDPLFADPAADDYHLRSRGGRWSDGQSTWLTDEAHSPAIDAGDPSSAFDGEPTPDGGAINLGCFGNTEHASKSNR